MEMWPKRSTLAFLTLVTMVVSGQDPVTLNGKKQRVPFGSPLSLNCKLQTSGYERFRMSWHFKPSGDLFNETRILSMRMVNKSAKTSTVVKDDGQDTEEALFSITSRATDKDSGWYFCRVTIEIPNYHIITSNGTEVIISVTGDEASEAKATVSPADPFQPMGWWLWIVLGVSSFVLIVLLITCVLLRRGCPRTRAEDPVYVNTHPVNKQPSPRPRMPTDNLKTESSSQNLQNPSPSRRCNEGKQRCKQ